MCEKPLSGNLKDARRMAQAARGKRVLTAVNFSYRNAAATQKAAQIVRSGRLGRIIHVEGCYLQSWLSSKVWGDWRKLPQLLWRLSIRHGSLGVLGDIGVHLYDLAGFVVGDFAEIACDLKTFDKGVRRVGEYVLDANDSFVSSVRFANGAIGTLHSSRWATGHQNTVALRVWGNDGALDLNLDRPGESQLRGRLGRKAVDKAAWKDIKCPPVPNMQQRFITSIKTGRQGQTSFEGAAVVQAYLEYSLRAAEKGGFVKIRV
jgi:predicted dehydrogenase